MDKMSIVMQAVFPMAMLAANTVNDLRKREILLIPTVGCFVSGLLWQMLFLKASAAEIFVSLSAGIFVLSVSLITEGAIGKGDSVQIMALGVLAGGIKTWMTLAAALGAAAVCAGIMWLAGFKTKEIPFVPFLLAAFGLVLAAGGYQI